MFRLNAWVNTDLVSAVIIWIEDLPQISINLYIAHCREDPTSGFQLFKAAIVLLGKTYCWSPLSLLLFNASRILTTISKLDASSAHDKICNSVHLSCKKTNSCIVNTASIALEMFRSAMCDVY